MGSCIKSQSKLRPCELISVSTVSNSVRLTSKFYSGIHEAYEFIKFLGHGNYGTVRLAFRKNHRTGQRFAVKSILKQKIYKHRQLMKRELEILTFADHPNIVKLFETFEDQLYLHLVLEYCSGGDVFERVVDKGTLSESEAAKIMKQLLSAVNYLHLNKITHRDLKPDNFLYESPDSDTIKVCDFGMSIKTEQFSKMKSLAGTPYYIAPEVLKGSYTKACDIWSLGVFMYFLLTGKHPFKGDDKDSVYSKAIEGYEYLDMDELEISDNGKDLLKSMLTVNEYKRITAKNALKHAWLEEHKTDFEISSSVFNTLRKFQAKNNLWREAMKVIVKNLSNKDIESMRSAFLEIDSERTGYILANDLKIAMAQQGLNLLAQEVNTIIRNISNPYEGRIRYTDFLVATISTKEIMNEQLMWDAFQLFDKNNSGIIKKNELEDALRSAGCKFTSEEFKELIGELESREEIDFDRFKKILSCFEEESLSRVASSEKVSLVKKFSKDFKMHFDRLNSVL